MPGGTARAFSSGVVNVGPEMAVGGRDPAPLTTYGVCDASGRAIVSRRRHAYQIPENSGAGRRWCSPSSAGAVGPVRSGVGWSQAYGSYRPKTIGRVLWSYQVLELLLHRCATISPVARLVRMNIQPMPAPVPSVHSCASVS